MPGRTLGWWTVLVVVGVLAASRPAHACWDGYRASVDGVTVMGSDSDWSAGRARLLAQWLPRIAALLPPDATLDDEFGTVTLAADDTHTSTWRSRGGLRELFDEVVARVGAPPATVQHARTLGRTAFVVQLGAFRDGPRARALIERVSAAGLTSDAFYEAGGFPSMNPGIHLEVVRDASGRTWYRVLYGATLDRAAAATQADDVRRSIGIAGAVRSL